MGEGTSARIPLLFSWLAGRRRNRASCCWSFQGDTRAFHGFPSLSRFFRCEKRRESGSFLDSFQFGQRCEIVSGTSAVLGQDYKQGNILYTLCSSDQLSSPSTRERDSLFCVTKGLCAGLIWLFVHIHEEEEGSWVMMIIILQRLQCHSARKRCCFRLFYVYWRHGKGQSRRRVLTTTIVSFKTKHISDVPTALEATVQCHSGGCRKQTSSLSLLLSHSPELSLTAFAATPGSPNLCTTCHSKKISFFSLSEIRKHGPDDAVWISDFEMNSSQGRVKVSWEPPSNSPFVEEKKEKKTPNQYTYAYGGCGAVMATLLGRAAFPLTWTRYWHMALFIFFASLVLPASTSGWFITFSVDIHTPFPEWGGCKYISCHIDFQ